MATYNQPTPEPTAKVKAVGVAGAAAVIVPLLVTILASTGVVLPAGLSDQLVAAVAAVVTIYSFIQAVVQFVAGYLKKSDRKELR